jgi:hypothetical protein
VRRGRKARRRLRLRLKRKDETFGSKVSDALDSLDVLHPVEKVNVLGHAGCLVVETVVSASVLALLIVPAYLPIG